MADERNGKENEQMDGAAVEEATEKLDKTEVNGVAGGTGTKDYNKPPELPEIP